MVERVSELRKICVKTRNTFSREAKVQTFFYVKFLRFFSIYFVKLALYTPLTSNGLTFVSMLTVILGGILLSLNNLYLQLAGIFFIILFSILDCADGELARYYNESSVIGRYFDLWVHGVESTAIMAGLTISIYHAVPKLYVLAVGFFAVTLPLLHALSTSLKSFHVYFYYHETGTKKPQLKKTMENSYFLGVSHYFWKNLFSFFFVPYVILATLLFDAWLGTFEFYGAEFNSRLIFLTLFALISLFRVIANVKNTLRLKSDYTISQP